MLDFNSYHVTNLNKFPYKYPAVLPTIAYADKYIYLHEGKNNTSKRQKYHLKLIKGNFFINKISNNLIFLPIFYFFKDLPRPKPKTLTYDIYNNS